MKKKQSISIVSRRNENNEVIHNVRLDVRVHALRSRIDTQYTLARSTGPPRENRRIWVNYQTQRSYDLRVCRSSTYAPEKNFLFYLWSFFRFRPFVSNGRIPPMYNRGEQNRNARKTKHQKSNVINPPKNVNTKLRMRKSKFLHGKTRFCVLWRQGSVIPPMGNAVDENELQNRQSRNTFWVCRTSPFFSYPLYVWPETVVFNEVSDTMPSGLTVKLFFWDKE